MRLGHIYERDRDADGEKLKVGEQEKIGREREMGKKLGDNDRGDGFS